MATAKQLAALEKARNAKKEKKELDVSTENVDVQLKVVENEQPSNKSVVHHNTLNDDIERMKAIASRSTSNTAWREAFFTIMKNKNVKTGNVGDLEPCKIAADQILSLFEKEGRV